MIRSLFILFCSIGGSAAIAFAGWFVNFIWVISEPIVAKLFVLISFAIGIGLAMTIVRKFKSLKPEAMGTDPLPFGQSDTTSFNPVATEAAQHNTLPPGIPSHRDRARSLGVAPFVLPMLTAFIAGTAILIQIGVTWNLPRTAQNSITEIPAGESFVSFRVDGQLYVADVDNGNLSKWEPETVGDMREVTKASFCLYHRLLINRDGKAAAVESRVDETTPMTDMNVINSGTHFVWRILRAEPKERNGLWMRTIQKDSEPTKYSEWGWDPVWTRDGETTYVCNGNGLFRIREGKAECVFETPGELYVSEATLSPDDQWVAFRVLNGNYGRKRDNRIVLLGPDGKSKVLYHAAKGTTVDKPQWSHDGTRVAFRKKKMTRDLRSLMVGYRDSDKCESIMELQPGAMLEAAGVQDFSWSPDDSRIAFLASLRGATLLKNEGGHMSHRFDLYVVDSNGQNFRRITMLNQEMASSNTEPVIWWESR